MLKRFLILLLLCLSFHVNGQHQVVTIDEGIYKSYFSPELRQPLYVVYRLYKGGGDCNRKKFRFKTTRPDTATPADYRRSGYEEGHLANAEDFAMDCEKDKKTFEFYNCLPQTLKLNRGIWKKYENRIRVESGTTHLLIICGGIFGTKKIGSGVAVPDYCWKIVVDEDSKKVLYCLLFPNDKSNTVKLLTVQELKSKLGYHLTFNGFRGIPVTIHDN